MAKVFKTSIARKYAMALSAIFLMIFLVVHLFANLTSVFSKDVFNQVSHFMGTNPLIQFGMQPILMFGVVFHFVMGFVLELQNRKARGNQKYAQYNGGANSSWMSRNMIFSGGFILIFLFIHLADFWVHEMNYKYVDGLMEDPNRYYDELVEKFHHLWRVVLYVVGFVFLCLHLLHGFKSSFQSIGAGSMRQKTVACLGTWYAYVISGGFIFVALFHYINFILK